MRPGEDSKVGTHRRGTAPSPAEWRRRLQTTLAWVLPCVIVGVTVALVLSRLKYMVMRPRWAMRRNIWLYPFKTGDVVLTAARIDAAAALAPQRHLANCITKVVTATPINHVTVAYVEPRTGQVFFWEINGNGTRMASIYDLVARAPDGPRCASDILVRPLNRAVDAALFESVVRDQWDCVFNFDIALSWYHRYTPLPYLPVPFLKGYHWGQGRQRTCAHLVTELYHRVGVLNLSDSASDPSCVFPGDYARQPIDPRVLPLANGYEFGPLILLDQEVPGDDDGDREEGEDACVDSGAPLGPHLLRPAQAGGRGRGGGGERGGEGASRLRSRPPFAEPLPLVHHRP
jgi:hypothetical protein